MLLLLIPVSLHPCSCFGRYFADGVVAPSNPPSEFHAGSIRELVPRQVEETERGVGRKGGDMIISLRAEWTNVMVPPLVRLCGETHPVFYGSIDRVGSVQE